MNSIISLQGCTATPFGGYLKALGVLRLISEQADCEARGSWHSNVFVVESSLDKESLVSFFLERYTPTTIVAPWNGGSGFYAKDNKKGIEAIASSKDGRFALYREVLTTCAAIPQVCLGKADAKEEESRRTAILLACRNQLPDPAVEWLDAAVGIAADESRSFAPVLGTGGNEGRLDYTNNFMSRVAQLLIEPDKKTAVEELLRHALFAERTVSLQPDAAGQYDPGRAGGANQGLGVSTDSVTNPWDFVLTLEGAVAWASGLYRRHGVSYRSYLCSPFTVRATTVGYGSSSRQDDARAEIWAPLWSRKARYAEIRVLLREGRASVDGRAAETGLQFAEAATSLGVDRSIDRFVRYSLLKRRGDSYVALPAGIFPAEHRSESDRIREIDAIVSRLDRAGLPKGSEGLRRRIESAMYETLLRGGAARLRRTVAALGRLLRSIATTTKKELPWATLDAGAWIAACGTNCVEVRIAAALASLDDFEAGSIRNNLTQSSKENAWYGRDLADRLLTVLERRSRAYTHQERTRQFQSKLRLHGGDATLFIEGSTDDELIEDLLFAFTCLRWGNPVSLDESEAGILPVYAAFKYLYLSDAIRLDGQTVKLRPDPRIPSILRSGDMQRASDIAIQRLRVAGLRPVMGRYSIDADARRMGAALLFPIHPNGFSDAILHEGLSNSARA